MCEATMREIADTYRYYSPTLEMFQQEVPNYHKA